MASVKQIYSIVESVAKQSLGSTNITVTNTGDFVSLGNQILSSNETIDSFYKVLCDRIGKTLIAIREYKASDRAVMRDSMEWGAILQKISFSLSTAKENATWNSDAQASPFDVESSVNVRQKLFSKIGTWSHEEKLPTVQLKHAFLSEDRMSAFISGIMMSMSNAMELELERVTSMAVNTNIASCLTSTKKSQKRDLLFEYNLAKGYVNASNKQVENQTALTTSTALEDVNFLKFASREIKNTITNMKKMSTLFNKTGQPRFTDKEHLVVEILGLFASATDTFLQADTFHNELTALPNYEEVAFWQGSGESFDFNDVSKIHITNTELDGTQELQTIEKTGIIAFIHDVDSCASSMFNRRMTSMYNPRSEVNVYMEKADVGYLVDEDENAVVFFMTNPTV